MLVEMAERKTASIGAQENWVRSTMEERLSLVIGEPASARGPARLADEQAINKPDLIDEVNSEQGAQ